MFDFSYFLSAEFTLVIVIVGNIAFIWSSVELIKRFTSWMKGQDHDVEDEFGRKPSGYEYTEYVFLFGLVIFLLTIIYIYEIKS
jgi:hypothetical protein